MRVEVAPLDIVHDGGTRREVAAASTEASRGPVADYDGAPTRLPVDREEEDGVEDFLDHLLGAGGKDEQVLGGI